MSALLFNNARLIDPEKGTDAFGTLAVRDGVIVGPSGMDGAEVIAHWRGVHAEAGWTHPRETFLAAVFHDAVYGAS